MQSGSFRGITCLHVTGVNISDIFRKMVLKLWRQLYEAQRSSRTVETTQRKVGNETAEVIRLCC
jgi:hypothetical protein